MNREEKKRLIKAQVEARKKSDRVARPEPPNKEKEEKINNTADIDFTIKCLNDEEIGDARLYQRLCHGKVIFIKKTKHWYYWNDVYWEFDEKQRYFDLVQLVTKRYLVLTKELKESIEGLTAERKELDTEDKKGIDREIKIESYITFYNNMIEKARARVKKLKKRSRIDNIVYFADKNESLLLVDHELLDHDAWFLGVKNGAVNLRDGKLHKGTRSKYITMTCDTDYLGCSEKHYNKDWTGFINEIYEGDEELIKYVQKMFGYGLIGKVVEHVLVILYGKGRNGKGTIVETFLALLKDYACTLTPEILLDNGKGKQSNAASPEYVKMEKKRFVFISETKQGAKFDEGNAKRISGGNTYQGREPHNPQERDIRPTHLPVLDTNHLPHMSPTKQFALIERVHIIHHKLSYVQNREPEKPDERKADGDLDERLLKNKAGILAWLVAGCLMYQKEGIERPKAVRDMGKTYQADECNLEDFNKICVEKTGSSVDFVQGSKLYDHYKTWVQQNEGEDAFKLNAKSFGMEMKNTYEKDRIKGLNCYLGIRLKSFGDGKET